MGMKKILGTTIGSTLLAAFLLFSSVGVAAAQNSKEPVVLGGSNMQSSAQTNSTEAAVTQAISIGFNYVHATYCLGAGGFYYFVAQEGSVWWTADPIALIALAPACQTGNLVGFRVINSSGAWDQVVVLPTK
jgi:hypothetical protein